MFNNIFDTYVGIYENILSEFYPSKGSTGFTERNLSVNWVKAVEKCQRNDDIISWFEYQFGSQNNQHIDALLWNRSAETLFLIESKRFNDPLAKIREVGEDIVRLQDAYVEIKKEKRIDLKRIKHCYGIILADVWVKKAQERVGRKSKILKNFQNASFVEGNLENFSKDVRQRLDNKELANLKYYCKTLDLITSSEDFSENYSLLSLSWEIE